MRVAARLAALILASVLGASQVDAGAFSTAPAGGGSSGPPVVDTTSFTPAVTFSSPGDLSVSYAAASGVYYKVGKLVYVWISLTFTPTFTTATGLLRITGLPAAASATGSGTLGVQQYSPTAFPGGTGTFVYAQTVASQSYLQISGEKTGAAPLTAGATQYTSGTAQTIVLSGVYLAGS